MAAALASGFQSESEKVFWLVYDLGGGTFDAAVIHVRDGGIQVVNHGGDNHLGGKLLDWEIVEQLLIPAVVEEYSLTDFRRGNMKHVAAIAKLKAAAENAKIRLSRDDSAEVMIEFLCTDDGGEPVEFEYELKRQDVERLSEPFILRSINICKKVLAEQRLGTDDVEKVLLVGGPTLTPYLRERLADPATGLGIPLDFSQDPLTVVATGAAIFAGTQRLEGAAPSPVAAGQLRLELEYTPVGAESEPLVGGKVIDPDGGSVAGYTVEFVNAAARPQWRSGKLGLAPNGTFMTNLWAEKGQANTFMVELYDDTGRPREAVPDQLTYTIGLAITDPPLINSVGVALANNEMAWLIEKGAPLPARKRRILRTALEVRRGHAEHVLRIPVMEGRHSRADRNQLIGTLNIQASEILRDVPAGSEVEVTIEIDDSRMLRAMAFLPILDEEYEDVISYADFRERVKGPEGLRQDLDRQQKRLDEVREQSESTGDPMASQALRRIDRERMVYDAEASLAASQADPDAADKCAKRLLDLKSAIDEVEDALEWPALAAKAEEQLKVERNVVMDSDFDVTAEEKTAFTALEREIRAALSRENPDELRAKVKELDRLGAIIMYRQPGWWLAVLENLETKKHTMTNPSQADTYVSQARRAVNNNDVEGLKSAVQQLAGLLPAGDEDRDKVMSGLIA